MNALLLNEQTWVHTGIVFLILSLFLYVGRTLTRNPVVREMAWGTLLLCTLSLIGAIAVRSSHADYFALSNMYESMMVTAIWIMVAFLVIDRWFRLPGIGWPVCLFLLVMVAYAITLPTDIKPLQAALQSYWRSIHVPVILLSYAMFTLAFISSVVYLVRGFFDGRGGGRLAEAGGPALKGPDSGDTLTSSLMHRVYSHNLEEDLKIRESRPDGEAVSVNVYDEITYRCVAVGFPLLAIGIILGGLWANEAWGNYWSWDPKESMSLVTLLAYGVYLHMRVNGEHSAKTLAWVSVAGFVMMLITYFGVNIMGLGLHSYGKIG